MKKIFVLAGLLFFFQVEAQTINKPVLCGNKDKVDTELAELNEFPVWVSPSPVEKSIYIFYGNRETGNWSLVQVIQDIGCLVAFGKAHKLKDDL